MRQSTLDGRLEVHLRYKVSCCARSQVRYLLAGAMYLVGGAVGKTLRLRVRTCFLPCTCISGGPPKSLKPLTLYQHNFPSI